MFCLSYGQWLYIIKHNILTQMGLAVEENTNGQTRNVLSLDVHSNTSRLITQNRGGNESNNNSIIMAIEKNVREIYGTKSKIFVSC